MSKTQQFSISHSPSPSFKNKESVDFYSIEKEEEEMSSCSLFSSLIPLASATAAAANRKLPTHLPPSVLPFPSKKSPTSRIRGVGRGRRQPHPKILAIAGEEGGAAVAEEAEVSESGIIVSDLKRKLVNLLYGTDRGLKASSETRAEIVELITQLESNNPTPAPTEALALLNGKWILAYTSFSQLFPLLGSGRLPELVKVAEISQTIDSKGFTVQNSVQFLGPLATTEVTTNAKFEVRSPKRVQIKFEEGIVGTPQLTDSIIIPEKFQFFGQDIDLSPFKGVITPIQDAASSVARTISGRPPLKIPITNSKVESWLLTTYLDEELRISRGDGSSVFVLIKEGSGLLNI